MYASMVHLRILLQNYRNVRLTPSLYYCCSAQLPASRLTELSLL